jgi:hypothetical protein
LTVEHLSYKTRSIFNFLMRLAAKHGNLELTPVHNSDGPLTRFERTRLPVRPIHFYLLTLGAILSPSIHGPQANLGLQLKRMAAVYLREQPREFLLESGQENADSSPRSKGERGSE